MSACACFFKCFPKDDLFFFLINAPPNSLMDSTTNPKVKTSEGEGIWVHSLAHNTLRVEGHAGVPRWDYKVTSGSIIHTDLHKPNIKLVSA
jgi:hypothetical protein